MEWLLYEKQYFNEGKKIVCGVDEAGRGPLAGSVYAAAVIMPQGLIIEGVNDSKKLTALKREKLYDIICQKSISYSIASASPKEIDEINILNATFLAMKRAVEGLKIKPDMVLVDGNRLPKWEYCSKDIVKGDSVCHSIACASILAKVTRDRDMVEKAKKYPEYLFEKHKGYGTKLHFEMIKKYGISKIHRKSFLKKFLENE